MEKRIANTKDAKTCIYYDNETCTKLGDRKMRGKEFKYIWSCVVHVSKYTCSMYKPDFVMLMKGAIEDENIISDR